MRCVLSLTAVALLLGHLLLGPAHASAPSGFPVNDGGFICKGGSEAGESCCMIGENVGCVGPVACMDAGGVCRPDFVKGPGTKLLGTMTVIKDDHVTDWWRPYVNYCPCSGPYCQCNGQRGHAQALTVVLKLEKNGHTHVFAETYQPSVRLSTAHGQPPRVVWPYGFNIWETVLTSPQTTCEGWLANPNLGSNIRPLRYPEATMAQAIIDLAGLQDETVRPVITQATAMGPENGLVHQGETDKLGSVVECAVKLRFLKAPLMVPEEDPL